MQKCPLTRGMMALVCLGLVTAGNLGAQSGPLPRPGQAILTGSLDTSPGQHAQTALMCCLDEDGQEQQATLDFLLYIPRGYEKRAAKTWPLILNLHGSYQIGSDTSALLQEGLPPLLETNPDFPFLVISPQLPAGLPSGEDWHDAIPSLHVLTGLVARELGADPARISVMGFSMGGFGTWELALAFPGFWSAAVPIAGGWHWLKHEVPPGLGNLAGLPLWIFHGALDPVVPVWQARELVDAMGRPSPLPHLTIYPKTNHQDTWEKAYRDPALWSWLASQSNTRTEKLDSMVAFGSVE